MRSMTSAMARRAVGSEGGGQSQVLDMLKATGKVVNQALSPGAAVSLEQRQGDNMGLKSGD